MQTSMKVEQYKNLSVADYISLEKESGLKYEHHNGQIFAMAGGTYNHGLLCGNIYAALRDSVRKKDKDCKPLSSEIKLHIKGKNSYVHPDAMVICDGVEKSSEDANAVTNPVLIVEVLSKSTAEYDRGDKFHLYRQLPSLQEYVLIDQSRTMVEVFYKRIEADLWKISRYENLEDFVNLESIGIKISMTDLYFDVELNYEE